LRTGPEPTEPDDGRCVHYSAPVMPSSRDAAADAAALDLTAVVVAVTDDEPRVLAIRPGRGRPDALPSGPLTAEHRTLDAGLRAWVEEQTRQRLGYVEQLYTFGDRDRSVFAPDDAVRSLSVAYLALVREARPAGNTDAAWLGWYRYFPWEDWRVGRPRVFAVLEPQLRLWVARAPGERARRERAERVRIGFGVDGGAWDDERVLERYEILYEAGLAPESWVDRGEPLPPLANSVPAAAMVGDHRRILATAIGRLRGKIKYRPVVFELLPPEFTLLQLQQTVEALSGVRLHKQNFRRLVESQGLIEETGATALTGRGRPARLVRFRREVLLERPAPGFRLAALRRRASR
jgi:hypothetical protein